MASDDVSSPINPSFGATRRPIACKSVINALVNAGVNHISENCVMPVDPNEPTYCLCEQVSYDEMIGCDNPDVSNFAKNIYFIICLSVMTSHKYDMVMQDKNKFN